MATTFATEIANIDAIPSINANGGVQGGRLRRFRATVPYAGQAAGDDVVLARVPAGYTFAYGVLTASATAGSSASNGTSSTGTGAAGTNGRGVAGADAPAGACTPAGRKY